MAVEKNRGIKREGNQLDRTLLIYDCRLFSAQYERSKLKSGLAISDENN